MNTFCRIFYLLPFTFFLLLLSACSPSDQERAAALLGEAQAAYETQQLNSALVLLDSIDHSCPAAIEVRREAQQLSYRIQLDVEQRTLHETEVQLVAFNTQIDSVLNAQFEYVKSEYDTEARFVPKGTDAGDVIGRSYIHAAVTERGVTQLMSTYAGPAALGHTGLRLETADGASVATQDIPYNDGSNYQYKILETHYETVTYEGEKDGGALAFVALHADDRRLKATLTGGKRDLPVAISDQERTALAASYELGIMLRERLRLQHEHRTAELKVQWLEEKLNGKNLKK